MQRALCNASAEQPCEKHGSMHICNLDHGHRGNMHMCSCGAMFLSVKQSEIDRAGETLEKVQ